MFFKTQIFSNRIELFLDGNFGIVHPLHQKTKKTKNREYLVILFQFSKTYLGESKIKTKKIQILKTVDEEIVSQYYGNVFSPQVLNFPLKSIKKYSDLTFTISCRILFHILVK